MRCESAWQSEVTDRFLRRVEFMKRAILIGTVFAVLLCLSGLPLMAQGRSSGGMGGGGGMGAGRTGGMGMGRGPMDNGPMGRQPGMDNTGMNRGRNGTNNRTPMGQQKTPSQLLTQNTKLSSKVQTLLAEGTNVQDAASGFKNLGQFVAAVHISKNLDIPFDQLKGKVAGGDSLGKALHTLNPNLSHKEIKSEVKKGKHQAKEDIKASHQS
jgi:hypothetical protein